MPAQLFPYSLSLHSFPTLFPYTINMTSLQPSLRQPHLRPIEVQRILHQGAPYFLLRDGVEVATQQLLVPLAYGGLLALADGTREIDALWNEARLLYNVPASSEEAHDLFAALDEVGMLEGERYEALHADALEAWRAQPHRPMALAGMGYPAAASRLRRDFQALLKEATSRPIPAGTLDWQRGVALLSPHIDYPRGGAAYAGVWQAMAEAVRDADAAVILATDHKGSDPFTLTKLDYATPYGRLSTDVALRDALAESIGESAAYAGELRHRNEHSIELVVNWLHHMRQESGNDTPLPIVPVLVGSLHRFISSDGRRNGAHGTLDPTSDCTYAGVLEILRAEMKDRRLLMVASGDLAHVGPAFGGAPLDDEDIATLRRADDRLLAAMASGDADAFLDEIRRVRDANNVCGVAPIYLAMQSAQGALGTQHTYHVAPADDDFTSVVTIAGVTFT